MLIGFHETVKRPARGLLTAAPLLGFFISFSNSSRADNTTVRFLHV